MLRLRRIVFSSRLSHVGEPTTPLEMVVESATQNNARDGITGIVILINRNFIGAIEGFDDVVEACLARISANKLHRNIEVLADEAAELRHWAEWHLCVTASSSANVERFLKLYEGLKAESHTSCAVWGLLEQLAARGRVIEAATVSS